MSLLLLNTEGIERLLTESGIHIAYNTEADFVCLCPYHNNRNSPSMTVSRTSGVFNCFNPGCGEKGDFIKLMSTMNNLNFYQARRLIEAEEVPLDQIVQSMQVDLTEDDMYVFDQAIIDRTHADLWGSPGQEYMNGRGFTDETLKYFTIGYSGVQKAVMVPVHSYQGLPMGVVGRLLDRKKFLNSSHFQGRRTLFNVHRAKRAGSRLILVEASFDAMKIHQAGYPGVAAFLKGAMSEYQEAIIKRTFDEVVIFVDNDNPDDYPDLPEPPGKALAKKIYHKLKSSCSVYKVPFEAYNGLKDATDMTDEHITKCLMSAELFGLDLEA